MSYRLPVIVGITITTGLLPLTAGAYVGPGVGITMLGTFWTLVSIFGVLVAGMLVWPIRALWRRRGKGKSSDTGQSHSQ